MCNFIALFTVSALHNKHCSLISSVVAIDCVLLPLNIIVLLPLTLMRKLIKVAKNTKITFIFTAIVSNLNHQAFVWISFFILNYLLSNFIYNIILMTLQLIDCLVFWRETLPANFSSNRYICNVSVVRIGYFEFVIIEFDCFTQMYFTISVIPILLTRQLIK